MKSPEVKVKIVNFNDFIFSPLYVIIRFNKTPHAKASILL